MYKIQIDNVPEVGSTGKVFTDGIKRLRMLGLTSGLKLNRSYLDTIDGIDCHILLFTTPEGFDGEGFAKVVSDNMGGCVGGHGHWVPEPVATAEGVN